MGLSLYLGSPVTPIAEMLPRFYPRESEYDAPEAPTLMSRSQAQHLDAYAKMLCKKVRRGIRRESCPKCLAGENSAASIDTWSSLRVLNDAFSATGSDFPDWLGLELLPNL